MKYWARSVEARFEKCQKVLFRVAALPSSNCEFRLQSEERDRDKQRRQRKRVHTVIFPQHGFYAVQKYLSMLHHAVQDTLQATLLETVVES